MSSDIESSSEDADAPVLPERGTVLLGEVDPARSRHAGRRSAVAADDGLLVVGTADGTVRGFDAETLDERWASAGRDGSVVSLVATDDLVIAGERGTAGAIRALDRSTGEQRWRHDTTDEVGDPIDETRFSRPFVVDLATAGERVYAAARRYERDGDQRRFESVIYAFAPDGDPVWRYRTDASPIALAADRERVAIASNRCPGEHGDGLVVLDAADGTERLAWDPPGVGDRRVGDVALLPDGFAVTSHADYRGYCLDGAGTVRWRADLATPLDVGDERLYAYPNHVHATESGVVFVTGNTYPEEGRETDSRHPREHTAFGFTPAGTQRWTATVGGFAAEIAADGDRIAVPGAQNFRMRDQATHGLRTFAVEEGPGGSLPVEGVAAAATVENDNVAVVEEPVSYHDDSVIRGTYRLRVCDI
jgi:outer membrane protein assembly factor BamB